MAGVLVRPPGRLPDKAPPSDPCDPGEGGGGGDWSLLTVAKNAMLAYLIQGRLAQEGIEALLDSTNASPGAWLHPFGDQTSPVRVFVRRADLAEASLMMHEVDQPEAPLDLSGVAPPGGRLRGRGTPGTGRLRELRWLRLVVGVVVGLLAAAALSGLIVLGPCVSHWFCT